MVANNPDVNEIVIARLDRAIQWNLD